MNSGLLRPPRLLTIPAAGNGTEILDHDPSRSYLLIQNVGQRIIRIRTENDFGVEDIGFELDKGGFWEPHFVPTNPVFALSEGTESELVIVEGRY